MLIGVRTRQKLDGMNHILSVDNQGTITRLILSSEQVADDLEAGLVLNGYYVIRSIGEAHDRSTEEFGRAMWLLGLARYTRQN